MTRLRTFVFLAVLLVCTVGLGACASKRQVATAEDGPPITHAMTSQLVKGETTELQVKQIVGAEPNEATVAEDGRTVWVYAWSRATADDKGNVLALRIRTLTVWLKDGVVDDTKFDESNQ